MTAPGGNDTEGGDDELVMEFTPPPGFNIKTMAQKFAEMMEETNHALHVKLPHVVVEFEPGCSAEEIIDGYNLGLKHQSKVKPSNTNDKDDAF